VVLPIGEHKGSGLSMFMDIFGGVISGANFGGDVGDQYKAFDRPQDVGHFFLAMRPNLFVSEDEYRARIDSLIERVRATPHADGYGEILLPGEPEDRNRAPRARHSLRRHRSCRLARRGEEGWRSAAHCLGSADFLSTIAAIWTIGASVLAIL
jgi:LDH2 family malate/lactate/ureidoglycolate dehydrogenase